MVKEHDKQESADEQIDYTTPLYGGARGAAIRILSRVEQSDSYLDKLLEHELEHGDLNQMDKGLLTEIVNGVLRWQAKLDWVLTGFYHGEFLKCIVPVKNAMRIALYQIMFLNKVPQSAAVNESVEFIKRLKGLRSSNLVNAVLRNILHHINEIHYPSKDDDIARYFSVVLSNPLWITKRWIDRYGVAEAEKLLLKSNERPKLTIRVNTVQIGLDFFLDLLTKKNIPFAQSKYLPSSIVLDALPNIRSLEIFRHGWFSVQDVSASLAVQLAQPKAGNVVYDLCAAPGGKSTYAAELMGDSGKIVALDKYEGKLGVIRENATRLRLSSVETVAADARTFKPKEKADIVLVDAPCSGLGTLAKKPDIKWKRDIGDIRKLNKTQKEILANAATLVKNGGVLVYSTCTIEPEENQDIVEWFLKEFPEFVVDRAENYLPKEVCRNGYMQTLPHIHDMDGAFAARLVRKS